MKLSIKRLTIILGCVVVLAGVAIGGYLYAQATATKDAKSDSQVAKEVSEQSAQFSQELTDALVENCSANGNPLREAVTDLLRSEIQKSHNTQLIEEFFPQIPIETLEELIDKENKDRRKAIHKLQPVDCAKKYPNPNQ